MSSASPRDTAVGGIIAVASMSFLAGIFLMTGVQKLVQHDPIYIGAFLLIPCLVFAAVLNARRILSAVPSPDRPAA
jgi:hypothetical protein